jgi:hypothetical protein
MPRWSTTSTSLIKGMEIKGVTQNLPKFVHYMDGMAKALNVFGDTLRPTDYYEMFKYGRGATPALSDDFMLKTAPTLAQRLRGSSAGQAQSSFYQAIVGGRIKMQSVKEMDKYGLIDHRKVVTVPKTGEIKGLLPGAVKGWRLAAEDPYAWVNEVLLPSLKDKKTKKRITDPQEIQAILGTIFQKGTAAQMAGIYATQQARIEKDWNLVKGAKGLESAETFMDKDPFTAYKGVREQMNNFLQTTSGPLVEPAVAGLNALAAAITALTHAAKEHQALGAAGLMAGAGVAGAAAAVAAGSMLGIPILNSAGKLAFRALPAIGGATAAIALLPDIDKQQRLSEAQGGSDFDWRQRSHILAAIRDSESRIWGGEVTPGDRDRDLRNQMLAGDDLRSRYMSHFGQGETPKAEVIGNATLRTEVTVSPSPDFLATVRQIIDNGINAFRNTGAPATGSAGSTGHAMPETSGEP